MKLSLPKHLPQLYLVNSLCPNFSVSEETVWKIIKESPSKSCSLDPLPTWLLKHCLDTFLPVITEIGKLLLSTTTFPDNFKEAILTPLIKMILLNHEILKNFCIISNLRFISKIVEKVVAMYVRDYMTSWFTSKFLWETS